MSIKNLTAFCQNTKSCKTLSHFGQELTADVKKDLRIGDLIYEFFKQPYQLTIPLTIQLIIISMILQSLIESKEALEKAKTGLIAAYHQDQPKQFSWNLQ